MKKVTITRDEMEKTARWLAPFVGGGSLGLMFRMAVFADGVIRAGDRTVGAEAPISVPGCIAVPADALFGPLLSTQSDVVLSIDDGAVVATAGGFRWRFAVAAEDTTPVWPASPKASAWRPLPETAWGGVPAVA